MPITLDGTNGITTPTYGGADTSEYLVPVTQFKNRIINGAMVIDQRNAGASVTPINDQYVLDRWVCGLTQSSKYSVQQNAGSVTPPAGFTNYFGVTSLAATSLGASDFFILTQRIEGLNVSDLGWGTANAQTVTLSFWVRSSLTGTFGGAVNNSANDRSYPFSFTVSSANTWEQKSITIVGDTSGTWLRTNGVGINLRFSLGAGSSVSGTAGAWSGSFLTSVTGATSVVGTNGATFYITGVQLEVGSTATSFDYRPYGTELQLCQRYCYVIENNNTLYGAFCAVLVNANGECRSNIFFPVLMRASPTITASNLANFGFYDLGFSANPTVVGQTGSGFGNVILQFSSGNGGTVGTQGRVLANSTTRTWLSFSSEL